MIICGYPCIGKSSISGKENNFIDLESSCFTKIEGWENAYVAVAKDLSKQGFNVFVSSHDVVINKLLSDCTEPIILVYPDRSLKEFWINKVSNRYNNDPSEKNFRAMLNVKNQFDIQIENLDNLPYLANEASVVTKVIIKDEGYELNKLLRPIISAMETGRR